MVPFIHYESLIYYGGQDTGKVVGAITTELVPQSNLRFLPSRVYVTVTGLDDTEAWVCGVETADQVQAIHIAMVNRYRQKAQAIACLQT